MLFLVLSHFEHIAVEEFVYSVLQGRKSSTGRIGRFQFGDLHLFVDCQFGAELLIAVTCKDFEFLIGFLQSSSV